MTTKVYDSLKDSNSRWLGTVPSHWNIGPLKRLLNIQNGADQKAVIADEGYPIYGSGGIFGYANQYLYDGKSILLGRKGTIDKPLFVDGKFWTVDTMYWSKIQPIANPRFAYYLSTTIPFDYYSTSTALPSMTKGDLGSHIVCFPDIDEQQKIANFLDRETAKIDELIQKQERLIELIHEKQHSEILLSVSSGIQGNKIFQHSTNDWLDKIPAHWSEGNLKVLSKIYSGGTPDKSKQEYWTDGTVPWLNSGSVNEFYIHSPSEYITEEAVRNSSAKWISKGSVLVALAGQGKTKGMAAQLMFDSTCNQSMCAIVTEDKLDGNYLLWWLNANYQNIRNMAGGDLRDGLNLEMIGSIKCPIPPINEQREISVYLNSFRLKNIALINKCEDSIELLKEHRASLISAAVTGKIDLRELV